MSSSEYIVTAAPKVEAATADQYAYDDDGFRATAAVASEDCRVDPAKAVGAAVTYDDPKKFAPAFTKEQIAHLSVAALRGSGAEFESKVSTSFVEFECVMIFSLTLLLYYKCSQKRLRFCEARRRKIYCRSVCHAFSMRGTSLRWAK
jgi:hypothetical protein